jgi:hypothetical protein
MSREAGSAIGAAPPGGVGDGGPAASGARERDLLSSVCHDLKAPLASIAMGVAYLRRVLPRDDAAIANVVEALHRSSQRMSRTVNSFADLAKLQMHELDLDIRPVPVSELMQAVHAVLAPEAAADRVPLELEVDPRASDLVLPCDRARFSQIVSHLFACAVRVLPTAGTVTLRAGPTPDGSTVCFEIEARRPDDPSARAISRDLPKPELSIATGLVELHGGRLDVGGDERVLCLSFVMQLAPSRPLLKGPGDGR